MKKRDFILLLLLSIFSKSAAGRTEQAVTFTHDGLTVNARLALPAGLPPYRVVIVAPGSGANDKDATINMVGGNVTCLYPGLYGTTLTPYKGLSDALSDSGFAVLTYDKLEYSYPTGLGAITFHKLWLPVESALTYLKTRSDIDTGNMVLLGHSEGSTLIPYIARTQPDVKALISLAGPRRSVYDTLLAYQLNYITHTCGGDTVAAQAQGAQLIAYFNAIRSGAWNSSTPPFAGVSAAVWSDYIKVADSVVINYNLAVKQTLFIGLGNDINVPISTELSQFRRDIKVPADFYEIPGLNHYLTTSNDPATAEVLTDTIVYWLRRHTGTTAVQETRASAETAFAINYNGTNWMITAKGETLREVAVYDMNGRMVYKSGAAGMLHTVRLEASVPGGIYLFRIWGSRSVGNFKLGL